jgi:hypothetical protein
VALAVGAVLLPVALLPDLALGAGHRVEPADYPAAYDQARELLERSDSDVTGDVLVLPLTSYRAPAWNHRDLVLDPLGRYLAHDYVASDVLVIDGVPLSGEDPRVRDAALALALATPEERAAALGRIGIGVVVTDPTAPGDPTPEIAGESLMDGPDLRVAVLDEVDVRDVQTSWRLAMAAAWLIFLAPWALASLAATRRLLTRPRDRVPRRVTGE